MKYLVDTNVLSEPTKPHPVTSAVDWLARNEGQLTVNPIILGELELGILLLPAGRRRTRLTAWFAQGVHRFRVLELDADTAAIWSRLLAELKRKGRAMPIKDSLIAATARQHRLTVVTRNEADYKYAGVSLLNPFESKGWRTR